MPRALPLLVTLLAASAALAGCAENGNDPAAGTTPTGTTPPTGGTPGGSGGKGCTSTKDASVTAATPTWVLETSMGTIRVTLFCDKTPITAQNFVNLTEKGYFDGVKFHRVIKDFMDQAGDPLTKDDAKKAQWGTGGPGYDIPDEFYCSDGTIDFTMNNPQYAGRPMRPGGPHTACNGKLGLKHDTAGTLSMANAGANTGGSQFFLTAVPTPFLDGAHAVFGHTADQASLDVVLAINRTPTDSSDRPVTPVVITKATMQWS